MNNSKFLTVESIDGGGSTTVTNLVHKFLYERQIPVLATREPSDGPVGKVARQALRKEIHLDSRAMLGLETGKV